MINFIYLSIVHVANFLLFPFALISIFCSRLLKNKKYDIGIGPVPLINNVYWAKALRLYGFKVETFANEIYNVTAEFDFICNKKKNRIYDFFPMLFFIRSILNYKCIYIYFNGCCLQRMWGLWRIEPYLYRLAGVKIIVMPYGSDCQQFELTPNKMMVDALCKDYPSTFQLFHDRFRNQVKLWTKKADIVIGAMDSVDYLFFWNKIRQCHFAIDTEKVLPVYKEVTDKVLVYHAPNHTNIKGTSYLVGAVQRLKEEGYNIELVVTQGKTNDEILDLIANSDIVVDQLIIGWHGMFAMEAMAQGKPTICYLREDLIRLYEMTGCIEKDEIPLISADVLKIYTVLKDLVIHKEKLPDVGKKSREYVVKYHSLKAVGHFFADINREIGIEPTGNNLK